MHSPSEIHWKALKRVLHYVKVTIHGMYLKCGSSLELKVFSNGMYLKRGSSLELKAFSNSDWGGIMHGGHSTTKLSRKKCISRSSTEAEYKSLANATAEIAWVQNLLTDLGVLQTSSLILFCDNTCATYICSNPVYHSHMKHLPLDYHFACDKFVVGSLKVLHINSTDQLADALIKPLSHSPFLHLRSKIGVSNGSSILWGRGHIKEQ
uniref:Reverse transcriptase Ty1/copia-type domain-containing protein n=1 Tax=Lactuca sativa TaxID=4236 RepID=A0A9R1UHB6_LACSA|nr:hypothetical protein LSAT_V11C900460840 [Lactuca sativa]